MPMLRVPLVPTAVALAWVCLVAAPVRAAPVSAAPVRTAPKALPAAVPVVAPAAPAPKSAAAVQAEAMVEYGAGRFGKAAELFQTCVALDAGNMQCRFNLARSHQRDFALDKAEAAFVQYLKLEGGDPQATKRAQTHLDEVRATRLQLEQARTAQAAVAAQAAASLPAAVTGSESTPRGWQRPVGWATIGTGGAALAVAVVLLVGASGDQQELDALTAETDKQGLIGGLSYDEYKGRQEAINSRMLTGDVLAVTGVVLAGAGGWLLWTAPARTAALVPTGRGLAVAVRF